MRVKSVKRHGTLFFWLTRSYRASFARVLLSLWSNRVQAATQGVDLCGGHGQGAPGVHHCPSLLRRGIQKFSPQR